MGERRVPFTCNECGYKQKTLWNSPAAARDDQARRRSFATTLTFREFVTPELRSPGRRRGFLFLVSYFFSAFAGAAFAGAAFFGAGFAGAAFAGAGGGAPIFCSSSTNPCQSRFPGLGRRLRLRGHEQDRCCSKSGSRRDYKTHFLHCIPPLTNYLSILPRQADCCRPPPPCVVANLPAACGERVASRPKAGEPGEGEFPRRRAHRDAPSPAPRFRRASRPLPARGER